MSELEALRTWLGKRPTSGHECLNCQARVHLGCLARRVVGIAGWWRSSVTGSALMERVAARRRAQEEARVWCECGCGVMEGS